MFWGIAGSCLMFLGVSAGAFGAHGLKSKLTPEMMAVYQTAVQYHVWHALLLFVIAGFAARSKTFVWAGDFYLAGIILFSGSLYVLALTGTKWLGAITPIGGLCFLVGHALLAWAFFQQ